LVMAPTGGMHASEMIWRFEFSWWVTEKYIIQDLMAWSLISISGDWTRVSWHRCSTNARVNGSAFNDDGNEVLYRHSNKSVAGQWWGQDIRGDWSHRWAQLCAWFPRSSMR
jgi:hypothetical protein